MVEVLFVMLEQDDTKERGPSASLLGERSKPISPSYEMRNGSARVVQGGRVFPIVRIVLGA
jgi:hypothetical protein